MKILLAGTSFQPSYGGPAVSVSRLAIELVQKGVDVILWAPDGSAQLSPLVPELSGLQRESGPLEQVLNYHSSTLDLIHDNGVWLRHNHKIAKAAKRLGIKRVVTTRGMLEPWALSHGRLKKSLAMKFYQRADLNSAAVLHATADSEAENLRNLGLEPPAVVIPNGVDFPSVRGEVSVGKTASRRRALFLGRIHPKKGIPLLLQAWRNKRPSDWELLIAGPSEKAHDEELRKQADSLGITDDVTFCGAAYGDEKAALYHSAELFILPTYSENFGITVAEALAHEVPVLTTTGAPWKLLEVEQCGWWVTPDVDAIGEGLSKATRESPEALYAMGRRGREIMLDRFAWTSVSEAVLEKIYRPLLPNETLG